jgi:hypothetical protein
MGWRHVGAYPWEMFAEFPQVIRISWLYCSNYSAQKWQVKSDGQRYFVECLRKYERQLKLPGFVSSLIGSDAKIVSEGVLSVDRGFLRTRWMRILKGIETRKKDPGYLPGSITFEEIGKMWRDLDRMQALVLRECPRIGI